MLRAKFRVFAARFLCDNDFAMSSGQIDDRESEQTVV
jgi:hypothetical protein